jgi:hypothetical protein
MTDQSRATRGAGEGKEHLSSPIAEKFEKTGTWRRNEQGQAICDGPIPTSPGVYLFIVGGAVKYVGSALKSLHSRMRSYERRQRDQKSRRPVHLQLGRAIEKHSIVEVHTLVIKNPIKSDPTGLPIDYAIGLEAGLIQALDPEWNRRGRKLVLDDIDS